MSKETRAARIFYIVLIPVILVVVLLNSGILQVWLPAATCGGEKFSAVRYNYYYFSCYNEFINENTGNLASLGFDEKIDLRNQNYDANTTWQDHFRQEAETRLSYAVYYNTLADDAGYVCSAEDLAPVQDQLAANKAECSQKGIAAKNYYKAYYGSGMSELSYTKELTYEVRAHAYAKYLQSNTPITDEAIVAYMTDNQIQDYNTANIRLIAMKAVPDRFSGEVGAPQLDALTERLTRLSARLEAKPTEAETLAQTYSTDASAASGGTLTDQTRSTLPAAISDWCFDSTRKAGDVYTTVDRDSGIAYWVYFDHFGSSAAVIETRLTLQSQAAASRETQELSAYPVVLNSIGMTVVG
jgi:hypothetical protein